jgi:hypothetical protein
MKLTLARLQPPFRPKDHVGTVSSLVTGKCKTTSEESGRGNDAPPARSKRTSEGLDIHQFQRGTNMMVGR